MENELQARPAIVPLDAVSLAAFMDGRDSDNRAFGGRPQIGASNDVDAIQACLARFLDTKTTFDNCRKEVERLLLRSPIRLEKPLSALTHEDCLLYQHFLKNTRPAQPWILPNRRQVARSHSDWHPFAGPLSPVSQCQAIAILNAMFSWMVNAGYLAGNLLSLSRQRIQYPGTPSEYVYSKSVIHAYRHP